MRNDSQDFAVYDTATDTWQTLPDMPTGRQHLAAAAVGGHFYAVGGRSMLGAGEGNVAALEVFDPGSGSWTSLADMPSERSGLAAAAAGRFVLAFGGEGNEASSDGTFPDVDAYDTLEGVWQSLSPLPTPRHGIGAANLGGRIHVPGGGPVEGFSTSDVHEVYDPAAELFASRPVPALRGLGAAALAGALGSVALLCLRRAHRGRWTRPTRRPAR